jgi:hypothetical protein
MDKKGSNPYARKLGGSLVSCNESLAMVTLGMCNGGHFRQSWRLLSAQVRLKPKFRQTESASRIDESFDQRIFIVAARTFSSGLAFQLTLRAVP